LVFNTANPGPQSSDDATELVSLELADSVAPAVSTAAAAGQVSLVLVPATDTIGSSSPLASSAPTSKRRQSSQTHSHGSAPHGRSG
jgi:hypothetical protein